MKVEMDAKIWVPNLIMYLGAQGAPVYEDSKIGASILTFISTSNLTCIPTCPFPGTISARYHYLKGRKFHVKTRGQTWQTYSTQICLSAANLSAEFSLTFDFEFILHVILHMTLHHGVSRTTNNDKELF